ncbi:MAG: universal stress protein [Methanosarcinales archaeon]|nr:universal stress protein [Methanosarcinales archaeon]
MFEKILVPTDFSKYSQKVLECISEIPGAKEIVLLNVVGPSDPLARVWDPGARALESKEKLEKQSRFLSGLGLAPKVRSEVVMEGSISRIIQRVADEEKVSLVVMGARGKSMVEGLFLGNVAKDLLRFGTTDLLIMRYKMLEGDLQKYCSHIMNKVLITTDFSEPAEKAIKFIKGMEGIGEISLVNVVSSGESAEDIDTSLTEAANVLKYYAEEFEAAGLKVKVHALSGNPADEIIKLAIKEDVSLIAMSSHGKGWLKQLMVGSTTYEVAKRADRPVLVVRTNETE